MAKSTAIFTHAPFVGQPSHVVEVEGCPASETFCVSLVAACVLVPGRALDRRAYEPNVRLFLPARGRPSGVADIEIQLREDDNGCLGHVRDPEPATG